MSPASDRSHGDARDLRVLHFIEALGIGGAERTVVDLALHLRAQGVTVVVACLRDGPLREPLERAGVSVECLGVRRRSILWLPWFVADVLRACHWLGRLLKVHRIDVLHAHMADAVMIALAAGRWRGVPVVATFHGLGLMPRGRIGFDPRNALRRCLYRAVARGVARSTAVSPAVRRVLCEELGFDAARTEVLANGIDTAHYAAAGAAGAARRRELGIDDATRVVVGVGRLVPNKGQRDVIEAMTVLRSSCPAAILLLLGDGPQRAELEARIADLGLQPHAQLLGARDDVAAHLAMADVFVLASSAEGVPLALLEAMAAGTPIVATAVPGTVDIIRDGDNGLLVPYRDPSALAAALTRLLLDRELAARLAASARHEVRARYDIQAVVRAMAALYAEVAPARHA